MRSPEQIVDDVARAKGLVTPLPAYWPLSPEFAAECVRVAQAEAAAERRAASPGMRALANYRPPRYVDNK